MNPGSYGSSARALDQGRHSPHDDEERDTSGKGKAGELWRGVGVDAFLDAAPDGILTVDVDGTVRSANGRAGVLFGCDAGSLVGRRVEELLPEALRDRHVEHRACYVAAPRPRPMGTDLDLVARRLDGTEFPVDVSLNTIAVTAGTLVVAFVRDATERRRAERDAARLREVERRRRQALELNDDVVQGLAAAQLALELDRPHEVAAAVERALRSAKRIVGGLLDPAGVSPGELRRGLADESE